MADMEGRNIILPDIDRVTTSEAIIQTGQAA